MVANERLTVRPAVNFQDHSNPKPIILEVGTFGHILLTDTFQLPTDYYATVTWWRLLLTNTFNRQSGPWLLQDLQQQPCNAFEDWRSVERLVVDGLGGYSLITFPLRITAGETILCPVWLSPSRLNRLTPRNESWRDSHDEPEHRPLRLSPRSTIMFRNQSGLSLIVLGSPAHYHSWNLIDNVLVCHIVRASVHCELSLETRGPNLTSDTSLTFGNSIWLKMPACVSKRLIGGVKIADDKISINSFLDLFSEFINLFYLSAQHLSF